MLSKQKSDESKTLSRSPTDKRVAIIGAGVSGLACAKECKEQGLHVEIFEQGSSAGGIWNLDSIPRELQELDVFTDGYAKKSESVQSSVYQNLRTNFPRHLIGFSQFPFDSTFPGSKDSRPSCSHDEVARYIKAFEQTFQLGDFIQFNSTVTEVSQGKFNSGGWDLAVAVGGEKSVHHFDAVVIANGHYTKPHIPPVKNIHLLKKPCLHSHLYRRPESFANKIVVVLGNANSGQDLAADIASVAKEVFICGRKWYSTTDLTAKHGTRQNIHYCNNIEEVTGEGQIRLEEGVVIADVDVLMFCTGYEFDLPFLKNSGLIRIVENLVYPLYKEIFHPQHPSLVFVGLLARNIPFLVAEYQSKYISRVLSGKCLLPDSQTMMAEIDQTLDAFKKENGSLTKYLLFYERQFPYMNNLAALCGDVPPLSEWREQLYHSFLHFKYRNPLHYREMKFQHQAMTDAEQEFASVKI